MPTGSRKRHTKSRNGCEACKKARVKCDEQLPTCSTCRRRDLTCTRKASSPATRASSFRRFVPVDFSCTPPPRPRVVDDASQAALQFFCLRTLPILRICQPSSLWDNVMTTLLQREDSVREIAVTIGFAHRLQIEADTNTKNDFVQHRSLLAYDKALQSLRLSIASASTEDATMHAFGCLLMVLLESLRGAHLGLLVHLRSGLRIAAAHQCTSDQAEFRRETVDLLQKYRVSSSLFGLLATRNTTLVELTTQEVYIPKSHEEEERRTGLSAVENYAIIGNSVHLWHDLFEATTAEQQEILRKAVPKLRAQNAGLQASWTSEIPSQAQKQPWQGFSEAQRRLTDLALQSATTLPGSDLLEETGSFNAVLDLLENSLLGLRALSTWNSEEASPFSAGIGVIGALSLVALQCQDESTRFRALELMRLCPRREGLWDAQKVHQVFERDHMTIRHSPGCHPLLQSMHRLLSIE